MTTSWAPKLPSDSYTTEVEDATSTNEAAPEVTSSPPSLSRILLVARPEWPVLFVAVVLMIAADGLFLFIPILLARAYDGIVDDTLSYDDKLWGIHQAMFLVLVIHGSGILAGFVRLVARLRKVS